MEPREHEARSTTTTTLGRERGLHVVGKPGEAARHLAVARQRTAGLGDQDPLCADEVGGLVQPVDVAGPRRRRELDLDDPKAASEVEDEIDFVLVARAKEEGLRPMVPLGEQGQELVDDGSSTRASRPASDSETPTIMAGDTDPRMFAS